MEHAEQPTGDAMGRSGGIASAPHGQSTLTYDAGFGKHPVGEGFERLIALQCLSCFPEPLEPKCPFLDPTEMTGADA